MWRQQLNRRRIKQAPGVLAMEQRAIVVSAQPLQQARGPRCDERSLKLAEGLRRLLEVVARASGWLLVVMATDPLRRARAQDRFAGPA